MLDNLVKYIQSKRPPCDWKIHGFSIGDDFDLIINDSYLYEDSKMVKRNKGVQFYKSKDTNLIAGIFLPIPFFDSRQEEILNEIKESLGAPYFDHVQMNDRILYYTSHNLFLKIVSNDISKGLCLSIGECGRRLRKFTAPNIIDSYFGLMDHRTFLFGLNDRNSLPKLTQLHIKELESLLSAFNGDPSIKRFMRRGFILECDDDHLSKLVKITGEIEIFESPKSLDSTVIDNPSRYEMVKYWEMLFNYYLNSRLYIERTGLFNYTVWKKKELENMKIISSREKVEARLESLKNILCKIIDPDEKEFDLKEMISMHNYPTEDIGWLKASDY